MDVSQWIFVLAPGNTPPSEEALDYVTSPRDQQYEDVANHILETWPICEEPEVKAASWSSEAPKKIETEVASLKTYWEAPKSGGDDDLIPF